MKKQEVERLNFLIQRPFQGELKDLRILRDALQKFPYFQPLRMLYLRILYKNGIEDFSEQLKVTSLYCADRNLLYNYITQEDTKRASSETSSVSKNTISRVEDLLKAHYAFNKWLALGVHSACVVSSFYNKNKKFETIDRFLKNYNGPSALNHEDYGSNLSISPESHWASENDLMTETLAQLYVDQKKYDKALKAYKILVLKYSEKSSYFNEKILSIKNKIRKT